MSETREFIEQISKLVVERSVLVEAVRKACEDLRYAGYPEYNAQVIASDVADDLCEALTKAEGASK
jgi:hypothetical protein